MYYKMIVVTVEKYANAGVHIITVIILGKND